MTYVRYSLWCGAADAVGIEAEIHPSMNSTLHCHEAAAALTCLMTSAAFTVPVVISTSTWLGTRLKYTPVTPGMACKTVFISASLLLHPGPLSVRGSRSLVGGVAQPGRETERIAINSTKEAVRRRQNVYMKWTPG
jgi:hypothetical protein